MHLIQAYITLAPGFLIKASSLGGSGVHVFVFCSGFGMCLSHLNRKKSYGQLIFSRFKKVYLPYIFIVLISFLIPFMYLESDRITALLSHVFLFKMFFEKYEGSFGGQLWFVSTIIQFYLVFIPLFRWKERIKNAKVFLGICLGISVAYWFLVVLLGKEDLRIWNSFFLQYLWEFALGMYIAGQLHQGKIYEIKRSILAIVTLVGLGIEAFFALNGGTLRIFNDIPALAGYGALLVLLYSFGFLNKIILFVSRFSYEWFLVHILVFSCVFQIGAKTLAGQCGLGLAAFLMSVFVAWGYSKIIQYVKRVRKNEVRS